MNKLYRTPDDIQYAIASDNDPIKKEFILKIFPHYIDIDKFSFDEKYNRETSILLINLLGENNIAEAYKTLMSGSIDKISILMNHEGQENLTRGIEEVTGEIMDLYNQGLIVEEYKRIVKTSEGREMEVNSLMALAQVLYYLEESKGDITNIEESRKQKIRVFLQDPQNKEIINGQFNLLMKKKKLNTGKLLLGKMAKRILKRGLPPNKEIIKASLRQPTVLYNSETEEYDIVKFLLNRMNATE